VREGRLQQAWKGDVKLTRGTSRQGVRTSCDEVVGGGVLREGGPLVGCMLANDLQDGPS
jgi:hypothetical protein